ncbi:MAG: hypothetical protein K6T86_12130 [Pirellulales bacterium]|nr:hypothetical protein [Pirellulales bacterium]
MADPYLEWLGIPKHARPVTFYQLLGITPAETHPQAIEAAAARQTSRVQAFAAGPHAQTAARILQEIATARAVLLDPARRAAYDRKLQQVSAATSHPHAPPPPGSAQPAHHPPLGQLPPQAHGTQPARGAVPAQAYPPGTRHVVPALLTSGPIPPSYLPVPTDPLSQSLTADPLPDPLQAPRRTSRVALLVGSLCGGGLAFLALLWLLWTVIAGPSSDTAASNQPAGAAGTAPQSGATASAQQQSGSTAAPAPQSSTDTSDNQQGSTPQSSTPQGSAAGASHVPLMAERQQFKPLALRSIPFGLQAPIWTSASGEWAWIGRQLYSLQTGTPVTSTPVPLPDVAMGFHAEPIGALAADGSLLAIGVAPWGESIQVYDCRTGTKVSEITAQDGFMQARFIAFGPDHALLVIWARGTNDVLERWDVNQRLRRWQLPCPSRGLPNVRVSTSGSTLVLSGQDGLTVYDLNEGRAVGQIPLPSSAAQERVAGISPINKEIAVVPDRQLLVFDENLQPVLEAALPPRVAASLPRSVVWSPDGQAILVNGMCLVSRDTGKLLWLNGPISSSHFARVVHLGPDQLVAISQNDVQVISSPLATIYRSLAAVESGAAALVSPRQRVSVIVDVTKALYETPPQTAQAVLERVTQHLATLGIATDANQPVELHVGYQEKKQILSALIRERTPGGSRRLRRVKYPALEINLTLTWRGQQGPLSQTYSPGVAQLSVDLNLPDVHSAREHLSELLQSLPLAWFIPQDPNLPILPLVTD